jgi:hypothetical protein
MKLEDVLRSSFKFHNLVYISITQKCPIRCRHCFVESSPTRTERVSQGEFPQWIDGILAGRSVDVVLFSGGEPFSNPSVLRYGLSACQNSSVNTIVGTSAFWATSVDVASSFLKRYPGIDLLFISTDIYHEEFVPLDHLRNAVDACEANGISVAFQIVDDAPEDSEFVRRFQSIVDPLGLLADQVYFTPLGFEGRASDQVLKRAAYKPLADMQALPCPWLGAPWIHEDGSVCACPNLSVYQTPGHPLNLGNLKQTTFDKLSVTASNDPLVQSLRTLGPKGIVDEMPVESWGWKPSAFDSGNICDLCESLLCTSGFAERMRNYVLDSEWNERIKLLRILQHQEFAENMAIQ